MCVCVCVCVCVCAWLRVCDIYVIDILHVFACCAYESQTQYTCACMVACCNYVVECLQH